MSPLYGRSVTKLLEMRWWRMMMKMMMRWRRMMRELRLHGDGSVHNIPSLHWAPLCAMGVEGDSGWLVRRLMRMMMSLSDWLVRRLLLPLLNNAT